MAAVANTEPLAAPPPATTKNKLFSIKKKLLKIKKSNVSNYISDIVRDIIKSELFSTISSKYKC